MGLSNICITVLTHLHTQLIAQFGKQISSNLNTNFPVLNQMQSFTLLILSVRASFREISLSKNFTTTQITYNLESTLHIHFFFFKAYYKPIQKMKNWLSNLS